MKNRFLNLITIFILSLLNLSFTNNLNQGLLIDESSILNREDIEKVYGNQSKGCWNSDNSFLCQYWKCLPIDKILMKCWGGEDEYNIPTPALHIFMEESIYDFSAGEVKSNEECEKIQSEWQQVIGEEKVACFSGVFLSSYEVRDENNKIKNRSTWVLQKIKTIQGEWQPEMERED